MTKFDQALDYAIQEITDWKYRDRINKIYLYGSCARKEEQVDSDIDLYIELDVEIPAADIRDIKVKCNSGDWKLPDVDVKIGAGANALAAADLFHRNIKKDGIVLWEKK